MSYSKSKKLTFTEITGLINNSAPPSNKVSKIFVSEVNNLLSKSSVNNVVVDSKSSPNKAGKRRLP